MESLEPEIKLLYKFSNCKWVLSYYEELPLCNVLMNSLCNTTKECWNKNYEAFCNALEYTRRTFTYETEFNKEIAKYLLENARYKLYNLIVFISSKDSIINLIDFISEVKYLSMLKFKKIVLKDSKIDIDTYNLLCNVFNEKKLDINKIKADNLNFSNKDSDELMEINHISCVKESKNISLFKQCQTYRIEHDTKHFIDYINNCNTIVHTLSFSLKSTPGRKEDMDISPTKSLQQSLRCVNIHDIVESKLWKLEHVLPAFAEKFPMLKSYKLESYSGELSLLCNIIDFHKKNFNSKLNLDKILIGSKGDDECTIVENFVKILLISKDYNFKYIVKAKKMVLQFGSGKGLHYSNDDILIFGSITYLKLCDISIEIYDERVYPKQEDHLSKRTKLLNKRSNCFILMNKDIDYMTIKMRSNSALPNPNCKLLKIIVDLKDRLGVWKSVLVILERTNLKTRIDAKISLNDMNINYSTLTKSDTEIVENVLNKLLELKLVRLSLTNFNFRKDLKMNVLEKLSKLSTLTEYGGVTNSTSHISMRNINNENRKEFADILLCDLTSIKELKRNKEIRDKLENTHGYSLLRYIKIREY